VRRLIAWLAAGLERRKGRIRSPHTPLRAQIFRAFVLAGVLCGLAAATVDFWLGTRAELAMVETRLTAEARQVALLASGLLDRHLAAITELADAAAGAPLDPPELQRRLDLLRRHHPAFLTLLAADRSGALVAASPAQRADGSPALATPGGVADREYFRVPMARGGSYVSDVFRGRGFGSDVIVAVSAAIDGPGGERVGIVEGSLDLRRFDRLTDPGRLIRGRETVIVDRSGRRLAGTDGDEGATLRRLPHWPWQPAAAAHGARRLRLPDAQGRPRAYVAAFAPVPGTGWTVVVRRSVQSVRLAALTGKAGSLVVLLAALGSFAVVARVVARRVSAAVASLRDDLHRYVPGAGGQLAAHQERDTPREIAEVREDLADLADRFEATLADLTGALDERERLASDLRALAGSLERQVEQRTAELSASEARYREMVEDSLGLMCQHDLAGNLLMVNNAAARSLGRAPQELVGRSLFDIVPPAVHERVREYLTHVQHEGELAEGLMVVVTGGGEQRVWQYRNRVMSEPGREPYVLGHAIDVTERHAAEQRAVHLSLHDPLTGLANRALLREQLAATLHRARRERRPLAVVYVDLDGFKGVNDRLGHAAGDLVLQEAAARLRRRVRKSDVLARIGGDEFVAVIANLAGRDAVVPLVEGIVNALGEPWPGGAGDGVSGSVGVALWPEHGDDDETLLAAADQAMYRAKRQGKRGWAWADPPAGE
jgi:diguanylate cyclase (GGDEF)-like protein/PAS domain S-box-containing protein